MILDLDISAAQEKALLSETKSIKDYTEHLLISKADRIMKEIVKENSDKNPEKITLAERETIVNNATVKTSAEKEAEFIASSR